MFVVSVLEGESVRIGDRLMYVAGAVAPGMARVYMDGEATPFYISWDRKIEILPGVLVSVERNASMAHDLKFHFQAPREVFIREVRNERSP